MGSSDQEKQLRFKKMKVINSEQYKNIITLTKFSQYIDYILNVVDVSCLRNVFFYSESIFPVNFEVQSQFNRMQASWFNLVNKFSGDILLR